MILKLQIKNGFFLKKLIIHFLHVEIDPRLWYLIHKKLELEDEMVSILNCLICFGFWRNGECFRALMTCWWSSFQVKRGFIEFRENQLGEGEFIGLTYQGKVMISWRILVSFKGFSFFKDYIICMVKYFEFP
jgi:hypothetical protein